MKFFISNDIRNNSLLKLIVILTLVFLFFLWLTDLLLYFKIGFSYESIVDYYRGSEENFREPKSYLGLLEESHFHFFSMAIILVTLNHLILFSKIKNVWKLIIILASYISAFGDIAGGWLIRYISPSFAYFKLGSVIVLQISFAALLVLVLVFLCSGKDTNLRQFKS
jgi:hypothetical protein